MMTAAKRQILDPTQRSNAVTDFDKQLHRKVVGQEPALQALIDVYQMYTAGLQPPHRPIANLLFLGPTGTGKTRTVEGVAEVLYGDPRACIKIDCGEFQHSHEIAKLIGSPPGYLGHRETHPALTQEALNQWHTEKTKISIVLFDEIEKASNALWQLLLGILDKGTLTLGDNRRVYFDRALIVLTSNLGAAQIQTMLDGGLGFSPTTITGNIGERIASTAIEAAKRKFTPEFMNRIDKTVVFKPLTTEHLREILQIELGLVQQRVFGATAQGSVSCVFHCTDAVKELLIKEGTDPRYGARFLKRAIERNIVFPLANLMATGQINYADQILIELHDGKIQFVHDGNYNLGGTK